MRITSVSRLLALVEAHCPDAEMFRGQGEDWPLLPSIARHPTIVEGYENWRVFHEAIIERFVRLARPYFDKGFASDAEAWINAQHHGLPTRLLDWTTNPLKGLFFAVSNPSHDRRNGVLWAAECNSWREDLGEEHRALWETELTAFLPAQLNPRLIAQEGCFLSYPLPEHCDPLTPVDVLARDDDDLRLTKFIVPASAKRRLRRDLAVFGCQFRLLFPDPDGVARGIVQDRLES